MLIQLEIESVIKQIQKDLASNKIIKQYQLHNQSTTSSQIDQDQKDNKSNATSLFGITKSHLTSSQQIFKSLSKNVDKQVHKLSHVCHDTFMSDKVVRLVGSIIKFLRVFNLVNNPKLYQKLSMQIVQVRRLLRYNRFLSYARQIKPLLMKTNKKWIDYYNIVFKNLQLFVDINDTISYFIQMKLISKQRFNPQKLRRNVSNCYFVECLMFLYLNIYDYLKNRKNRTRQQNLRKQLTIAKYALDSFTSHNQFSRRKYTLDPKTNTIIGGISSIVGLIILWV